MDFLFSVILSVLIWIQTVCNGYQQMAKVAASQERIRYSIRPDKQTVYLVFFFVVKLKKVVDQDQLVSLETY